MAQTKKRTTRQAAEQPAQPPAGDAAAPADERTAIDDIQDKKGTGEALPDGFRERLPAGVPRVIRVNRGELGKAKGKVWRVREPDGTETDYDNVAIEGPSRGCRVEGDCRGEGAGVAIETEAAILVGRGKQVKKES